MLNITDDTCYNIALITVFSLVLLFVLKNYFNKENFAEKHHVHHHVTHHKHHAHHEKHHKHHEKHHRVNCQRSAGRSVGHGAS